jgi:hypothetical protein
MMVREGLCFVVVSGQLPEVAMNVVRITVLGFQLNGHVFDPPIRRDSVLVHLEQLSCPLL